MIALGIVTPTAAQRTAFEKNRRSDARTIMHGKTSDIENQPFH